MPVLALLSGFSILLRYTPVLAAPTGAQVTGGAGTVTQSGNTTTVQQNSADLSLSWQSFNVGANETVNFVQPSASAIAVNRILSNSGSDILGHLNANGQVWLINPNGVLFGRGAQVDVGGLTASTLDVSDAAFASNLRTFSGAGTGSVVNQGSIRAADGGYVALLGNQVSNQGLISARLGTVALGAGSAATLTFDGRQLLHLRIEASTVNDLAQNRQLIEADGGQVIMTAGARDSLLASVVNNTGVIEARGVEDHGGTITLLAGMRAGEVHVGGSLDASGHTPGAIETSGASLSVAPAAKINAGQGGSWLVDPTDLTIDAAAASSIDSALNAGTSVTEQTTATSATGYGTTANGNGDINVNAPIAWSNAAATLTLSAYNAINVNASVNGKGAVAMQAAGGNLSIASGASIEADAGVVLGTGGNFINSAGSNAVSTGAGSGRWLVYSTNPTLDVANGLAPGFVQYAASYQTAPAQASGNGFLYSVAPTLTVSALTGAASKTYDGSTTANLGPSNYTVSGLLNNDAVSAMVGSYASANAGTNLTVTSPSSVAAVTVTTAAGAPIYGYALAAPSASAAIGTITPAPLTASIVGDPTKVYDGTTTATLSSSNYALSGFITGQSATVNQPSSVAYAGSSAGPETVNATFANTNFVAGSGTSLSNYALPTTASGSGTVQQAPLVVTGVLASNKIYDATTVDTLDVSHAGVYGVITGDSVSLSTAGASGAFASANAANGVVVSASGFSLSGAQSADYRLVLPSGLSANIAPATLTVGGVAATNKVYDGTAADSLNISNAALSGVLASDASSVALSTANAAGTFSTKNVGTALSVSSSGFAISGASASNYVLAQPSGLSANITPAALSIALVGNPSKPYNGTSTADLTSANFTLSGFVSGEGASVPQTASAQYDSANAGTRTVSVTLTAPDFAPNAVTSLSNYTLPTTASGAGTITPAPLTGALINNPTKVYDGNATATLNSANYQLTGFVAGDSMSVTQTSGTYGSANAGLQSVSASVSPANYTPGSGTLLSNYSLPSSFSGFGTITQAAVGGNIIAAITGNPTKIYDGTTAAILGPSNFTLSGFVSGQGASVTQTVGTYSSANAGPQSIVASLNSSEFVANSGTNLSNYTLPSSAFGTGTITPATLSISIGGNPTRVYNGSTSMVLTPSNYLVSGFVSGQGASINPSSLVNFASANVGTQAITASLTPSAYTANSGTSLSNYVLASSASGTGTITPAPLTVTGIYATNKVYDTGYNDPLNTAAVSITGIVPGDASTVILSGTPSGSFATVHMGAALPVTVSGYSLSGSGASNYALQPIAGFTANITPAPLSIAGVTANSKPYDRTASATLDTSSAALVGVLGSDVAQLDLKQRNRRLQLGQRRHGAACDRGWLQRQRQQSCRLSTATTRGPQRGYHAGRDNRAHHRQPDQGLRRQPLDHLACRELHLGRFRARTRCERAAVRRRLPMRRPMPAATCRSVPRWCSRTSSPIAVPICRIISSRKLGPD